ncbi:hypothetical protein G9A89_013471 [Geosiphon pyriformis]|nr:hypothetical protein G9A89_013471 [Geosiphon pyriformis]
MAQQEGSKNPFYETSIFTTQTEQLTQKVSKGNVSSEIRTPIISLYPPPVRVGIQSPTDNILSPCSAKLQAKKTKTFNKAFIIWTLFHVAFECEGAVMAIDYGTEWFKVALVKSGVPMDIVLNRDSKRKTQSVLTIREKERYYGSDSVSLATRFPRNTFFSLKRILGRNFDDKFSRDYRDLYSNDMIPDSHRNTIAFQVDNETYSVEELVAMQFAHAKELAQTTAQEVVRDVVITVPPFFNQFERRAILDAADLAGLNVISLIHDETAVAINYAINQFSSFKDDTQHHIFYDMGAGSTVASLISFKTATIKDIGRFNKSIVHVDVKSVGYDRSLGGQAFDVRLQKHLANEFDKAYKGKTVSSVFTSERAMIKLMKEANRVKQILSANTETIASIENLHEEFDFRLPITRSEFETLSADLLERVNGPIEHALKIANMTTEDIKSLVLVGGGVRIPAIQSALTEILGEEKIAKNVNGDEAAALGAVFRGAGLSGQFKVKEIKVKDVTLYPIDVEYASDPKESEDGILKSKVHRTVLFKAFSSIGVRKVMTFKRTSDFEFALNYSNTVKETISEFGPTDIASVQVIGLSEAIKQLQDVSVERPKVKVTLELSDSGTLSATDAIATIATEQTSFADKFKSFFGVTPNTTEEAIKDIPIPEESVESQNPTSSTTSANNETAESSETESPSSKKTKIETVKLSLVVSYLGIPPMSKDSKEKSFDRLRSMDQHDFEIRAREEARNNLEAFVYRVQDFLHDDIVIKVSSPEERNKLLTQLSEISEWIYEGGEQASTDDYKVRLDHLTSLHNPLVFRQNEYRKRPEAVSSLKQLIQAAREYVQHIHRNISPDHRYHSDYELQRVNDLCNNADNWLNQVVANQGFLLPHVQPAFTSMEVEIRKQELHKEYMRLVNKKPPRKITTSDTSAKSPDPNETKPKTVSDETNAESDSSFTTNSSSFLDNETSTTSGPQSTSTEADKANLKEKTIHEEL